MMRKIHIATKKSQFCRWQGETKKKRILRMSVLLSMTAAMLLSGCGRSDSHQLATNRFSNDSIVMTIGNETVKCREIKDYSYFLKCQYDSRFGKKIWQYSLGKSGTIGDQAKQEIVNMITQLRIINTAAASQNVKLTNDEVDEANLAAENLLKKASAADKKKYSLNAQEISEIYQENELAEKMFYRVTNQADTNVSDEEAKQISIQYLEVMTAGTDRNGTRISMNTAEKKAAWDRVRQMKADLKSNSAFYAYAQKNTDAKDTKLTFGKDTNKLDSAVVKAAFSLKTGQMSDVITGKDGYYIVYCTNDNDEKATYQKKEAIIEERQTSLFQKKYETWVKGKKVNLSEKFWNQFSI
jgi:foldase protein PrsA